MGTEMTGAQGPLGCFQPEVHVYCLLPGGKLPSVIDLFRSHHWKKNPGDNAYLPLKLSPHRLYASPSLQPLGEKTRVRGGREDGPSRCPRMEPRGRRPPHPSRPLGAEDRGHGGFLSLPSLTFLSNDFSLVLRSIHIHFQSHGS